MVIREGASVDQDGRFTLDIGISDSNLSDASVWITTRSFFRFVTAESTIGVTFSTNLLEG